MPRIELARVAGKCQRAGWQQKDPPVYHNVQGDTFVAPGVNYDPSALA